MRIVGTKFALNDGSLLFIFLVFLAVLLVVLVLLVVFVVLILFIVLAIFAVTFRTKFDSAIFPLRDLLNFLGRL